MKGITQYRVWGLFVLAVSLGVWMLAPSVRGAAQSSFVQQNPQADEPEMDPARRAMALRALHRAFDTHVHVDLGAVAAIDIAKMKMARKHGMRGMVLKNHHEPTVALAFMARKEVPGLEVFGMTVLNPEVGGINVKAVEYMAQSGAWGAEGLARFVSMPTIRYVPGNMPPRTHQVGGVTVPDATSIVRNGELLPEVKAVISLIVKNNMVLATGHANPEETLMLLREARKQGPQKQLGSGLENQLNLVVTHEGGAGTGIDEGPGRGMTLAEMQEAVKLGALVEFDARDILVGDSHGPVPKNRRRVVDLIHKLGPEHSILHAFWTNRGADRGMISGTEEYAGLEGMADFVEAMHAEGFTDRDLDLMMKENPARLFNLPSMR